MANEPGKYQGRGGPEGGMPTDGRFGANQVPGPQVQANLDHHSQQVQQNQQQEKGGDTGGQGRQAQGGSDSQRKNK
ncbi:MAG TPA: hypothetical protein VD997_09250 [Phycisphaerales bacterium]|nr:hypothetical protein [Phycisphaerales bacterium]